MKLVLSCEHAGNEIPEQYDSLFKNNQEVLETHRGYDPGALDLFNDMSKLAHFSQQYMISRLLVEPNRSLHHPQLFSEFTGDLPIDVRKEILADFYIPYRDFVESRIQDYIGAGETVLHISVHSFTPELNGEVRQADVGLLFDPARKNEKSFCIAWRKKISQKDRDLRIRFNYPYLGKADGFTSYLRGKFQKSYLGLELEVNQKFVKDNRLDEHLKKVIFSALSQTLQERTDK